MQLWTIKRNICFIVTWKLSARAQYEINMFYMFLYVCLYSIFFLELQEFIAKY